MVYHAPANATVSPFGPWARRGAALTALMGIIQAVLGATVFGKAMSADVHGTVGFVTLALAVITAVLVGLWLKSWADKGLLWHAIGVAVLAVVQVGLGEAHQATLHMAVGVLFLVGAIALATLAFRKHEVAVPRG